MERSLWDADVKQPQGEKKQGVISVWVPAEPSRATAAIFKLNMCGSASLPFQPCRRTKVETQEKTNPQYGKEKEAQSSQGAARDRKKGQAPRVPS